MATLLDPVSVATAGWRRRPSARKLADHACRDAIEGAGLQPDDIDLLLNTGLYHDRNLGEPALAALIQEDVGSHPEDPHRGSHGTFSFDVANGGCGVLTALQVANGFLESGTIDHALVVASDANPGRHMAPHFPFSACGAAVVCHWDDGPGGIAGFHWNTAPDEGALLRARVGFDGQRNRLDVEQDPDFCVRAAPWAAKTARSLLAEHGVAQRDIDLVVASPLAPAFLDELAGHLHLDPDGIVAVEEAERVHTAALLVALAQAEQQGRLATARRVLLVSAGAGIVVGAALLTR